MFAPGTIARVPLISTSVRQALVVAEVRDRNALRCVRQLPIVLGTTRATTPARPCCPRSRFRFVVRQMRVRRPLAKCAQPMTSAVRVSAQRRPMAGRPFALSRARRSRDVRTDLDATRCFCLTQAQLSTRVCLRGFASRARRVRATTNVAPDFAAHLAVAPTRALVAIVRRRKRAAQNRLPLKASPGVRVASTRRRSGEVLRDETAGTRHSPRERLTYASSANT